MCFHSCSKTSPYAVTDRVTPSPVSRWADSEAIYKRVLVDDEVQTIERVARLTRDDFALLFAVCGLSLEATYGDYELHPFNHSSSPRLILVARKSDADLATVLATLFP